MMTGSIFSQWTARAVAASALCGLVACADLTRPQVDVAPARPWAQVTAMPVVAPASAGAIFPGGDAYRPLFENIRARMVGDIVLITIQENTTASQSSNAAVNRTGKMDGSITAIPFINPAAPSVTRGKVAGALTNDSAAKGSSDSNNVFTGTITATVTQVLPNGNLLIVGEKQVGVNQTVDSLRFSGVIDPRQIRPPNMIASTQVADVRLEFRGRGDIDRALTTGWMQKIFFRFAPL
jgi:flagellar L-ring protein precursor FlgH